MHVARSAICWAGMAFPAAHRETVGLPHRGDGHDLDRHVEVAHHMPDHRHLLEILLPEECPKSGCTMLRSFTWP